MNKLPKLSKFNKQIIENKYCLAAELKIDSSSVKTGTLLLNFHK
jgi:hypothetical protein